ncbi:MAG TPA: multicopper oxidase domain-containing protein [Thermoanaerobaculia bacterium]|nr:multicopper oxidase domain-containing protein [Thermoanaerobaculia bacterium]HSK76619.1 multicopper oxidase domain-containing protein [Thermoanaerobaculia bacterium]
MLKTFRWLLSAALALGTALPALAQVEMLSEAVPTAPSPLPELESLRSGNGTMNVNLRLQYSLNRIGKDTVSLRSYDGRLVGPTLRVKPGDVLNVWLDNQLPCLTPPCRCQEGPALEHHHVEMVNGALGAEPSPSTFNTTNLHTHGLHVSPKDPADNVLREVLPGCSYPFQFQIPKNHPAGTFWYHPHVHGSTAIQVGSSGVGALIVEGGLDLVPEIRAAEERILVFQQIPYTCKARETDPQSPCTSADPGKVESFNLFGNGKWPKSWQATTINGEVQPVIHMQPGEVQRWRMIHGGVRETILAGVATGPSSSALPGWLHEIALDGLPTGEVAPRTTVELQPGYRADLLVKAQRPGTYYLIDKPTSAEQSLLAEAESQKILAVIVVSGAVNDMRLPTNAQVSRFRLPSVRDEEVLGRPIQSVIFNIENNKFTVDGEEFPGSTRSLQLGKADEWKVESKLANHPFHIHVNPFEVLEKDSSGRVIRRYWKDTILVKPGQPLTLRSRYEVFDGKFVLHCHILDHEDRGMMQYVEIKP